MDVLNIIKSYIFYDMETLKFTKKVASKKENLTEEINNSIKVSSNTTGYWGLHLKPQYQQKPYFQGYNCNACGEFTLVHWKKHKNIISRLPICFCSDEDY